MEGRWSGAMNRYRGRGGREGGREGGRVGGSKGRRKMLHISHLITHISKNSSCVSPPSTATATTPTSWSGKHHQMLKPASPPSLPPLTLPPSLPPSLPRSGYSHHVQLYDMQTGAIVRKLEEIHKDHINISR